MKKKQFLKKSVALLLTAAVLLTSCASSKTSSEEGSKTDSTQQGASSEDEITLNVAMWDYTSLEYHSKLVAAFEEAVFTLLPVLFVFFLSVTKWDTANPIEFVGIDNFTRMFSDSTFKISLFNTFYYAVGTVPITLATALGLALILNSKIKGRNLFRTIFFFPYVASLIAAVVVWNMIFHPDMGPVNGLLSVICISNLPRWGASTTAAMPTVILFSVWRYMGYYMIMYLAALKGIPRDLYEAAK